MKLLQKIKQNKGFTLIELLVVISIIGLLSAVVLASLNNARTKAVDAKRVQELAQIRNALELYASDNNGLYPPPGSRHTSKGTVSSGSSSICGSGSDWPESFKIALSPYISVLPKDPDNTNNNCYVYSGNGSASGVPSSGALLFTNLSKEEGDSTVSGMVIGTVDDNEIEGLIPTGGVTFKKLGATSGVTSSGGDVYGCTDSSATNYDPSATVDDSSCSYDVYGCTDSTAMNFNESANVDDGTCDYGNGGGDNGGGDGGGE